MNDSIVKGHRVRRSQSIALEILTDVILAVALFTWFSLNDMGNPLSWLGPLLFLLVAVTFAIIRRRHR